MSALLAALAQLLWGFALVGFVVLLVAAPRQVRADLRNARRPFVPEQRPMTAAHDQHQPEPCPSCAAPVVPADVLAGPPGNVGRHLVLVDPPPLLPEPDLLLHLGRSTDSGRWLLVTLAERAGQTCQHAMPLPHAHRQHVCAVVPAAWSAAREQVSA